MSRAFKIENIYDMYLPDNKDTKFTTAMELTRLEKNYAIVSDTAAKLKKLPDFVLPNFNTTKFDALIRDLKVVISLVRREMKIPGTSTAAPNATLPPNFAAGTYNCLCPLTVLLQAVASSLSELDLKIRVDKMGSTTPFYRLVKTMEQQLIKENGEGDFCNGLAHAITIHEKNSKFTILSSAPRYRRLKGLQWFATDTRTNYLATLQSTLPAAVLERVRGVEEVSKGISQAAKEGKTPTEPPVGYERVALEGTNITITAKGAYKPACLSDYLRLAIATPPEATEKEAAVPVTARKPQNYKTCAEWLMVCYLYSNPDPADPSALPAGVSGHKKANSWPQGEKKAEATKPQQKQAAAAAAAAHPSPLPALGKPQPGKAGRSQSPSPATTTTLTDRTKAAAASAAKKPATPRKVS